MKTQDQTVGYGRRDVQEITDSETSYLPVQTSARTSDRWQQIQSEFVDDPRKSVTEAHQLVGELMDQIVANFTQERDALERQWAAGSTASTEELRICLQRYRDFFARLLPAVRSTH